MTVYMRAREIISKPVVTLSGDAVGQVKDIVFDSSTGSIRCFTLVGRGLLSRPLHQALRWEDVHALGPHAVTVRDERALEEDDTAARPGKEERAGVNVLGLAVTTRSGTQLGTVTDAVVATGRAPVVAGYEVETAEHRRVLLPVAGAVTVSGERVLVADITAQHSAANLGGFAEAVEKLRDLPERDSRED
ncbi:PRC-barrel domain-containing protein [Streptomyces sp. ATCC 21386]|uniref:PRC-barrel domain-containing protein n=1 Tax=Streptomyces sp. ATCC 21386 TaxID=2699428 RepID=UPI001BFEF2A5|nr:PRC-barrel domain-containing protein [Streptomyces sp. ATCC 21386]